MSSTVGRSRSDPALERRLVRRASLGVFLATLGLLLATHGGHFYAADSMIVHLTAQNLVERGRLDLGPVWSGVQGADGLTYGRYGIGLSLLHAPLLVVGRYFDALAPDGVPGFAGPPVSIYYPETFAVFATTLVGPLCGALAAATFWQIALLLGFTVPVSAALTAILVLGTQLWPASRDSLPHVVVLLLELLALRSALGWRRPVASAAALGASIGFLFLVRPFDAVLAGPALLLHAAHRNLAATRRARVTGRCALALLAPLALAGALGALHNWLRFADVLAFDEPGAQSFQTPLVLGIYGLLFSAGRGLLFFSPPIVAGLFGLPSFARRRPAETALIGALSVAYLAAYGSYTNWEGGLCWGPRYVVPLVPFLLLPAGELLSSGVTARLFVAALGVAGLVVQVLGTLVDFQRLAHDAGFKRETLYDPALAPIVEHWRFLTVGKHIDWLPMRILDASGPWLALAYLALPLALLIAGVASVLSSLRAGRHVDPVAAGIRAH
jgi:hypothetical protein